VRSPRLPLPAPLSRPSRLTIPSLSPFGCDVHSVKDLPSTLTDKIVFFSLNLNLDALARPLGLFLAVLQFLLRAPLWAGRQAAGGNEGGRRSVLRASGSAGVGERAKWEGRFGEVPRAARSGAKWVNMVRERLAPVAQRHPYQLTACVSRTRPRLCAHQSTVLSLLLVLVALLNALYLFSRTRTYRLQMRANPSSIGSPNARVVDVDRPAVEDETFGGGSGGGEEDGQGWLEKAKDGRLWVAGGRMVLCVPYCGRSERR
jgi:hypothetical protein